MWEKLLDRPFSCAFEKDNQATVLVSKAGYRSKFRYVNRTHKINVSIKFFERAKSFWKYKGRICYRGDAAKDQNGAYAIYQELNASPTSIHSANSNLAYGMLPGSATTQADAVRAYV